MKQLVCFFAAIAVCAWVFLGASCEAQARGSKITKTPGKCIASSRPLPKLKPATWRDVRRKFDVRRTKGIYIRCFYKKKLGAYYKVGRVSNSMRDGGKYWMVVYFQALSKTGGVAASRSHVNLQTWKSNKAKSWKGGIVKIGKLPRSAWNVDLQANLLRRNNYLKNKWNGKVNACVAIYFQSADKHAWVWKGGRKVRQMLVKKVNLAEHCIELTVR